MIYSESESELDSSFTINSVEILTLFLNMILNLILV